MKKVNIYVRGTCKNTEETKEGRYIGLLEYKGKYKKVTGKELYTTSNRMLITAAIKSIELLKEPCIINLYTPTNLGFKSKKSPNIDLLKELFKLIAINKHELIEVVSKDKQYYLDKEINAI